MFRKNPDEAYLFWFLAAFEIIELFQSFLAYQFDEAIAFFVRNDRQQICYLIERHWILLFLSTPQTNINKLSAYDV